MNHGFGTNGAAWVADQLVRMSDGRCAMQLEIPRYNPRPAGVIRTGGASHAVLQVLSEHPLRYFTAGELILMTHCTHAAVSWALIYLRSLHLIEASVDDGRNARYNKYRLIKGAG